uniref:Peptidase M12B domain-containing protein n=1 Tax=Heterorhabditis bacteriophora TaxID=37862 RepID=A0A1I7WGL1_HETBA
MCSYDYSGGVDVDHSTNAASVAATLAHEMGHNFGMEHDVEYGTICNCPVNQCIMAPSAGLKYLSNSFNRGVDLCLKNPPEKSVGNAKCGNGIVEHGEPKPRATECRASTGLCDLAEYCNGETSDCPADFFIQNGHNCPGRQNVKRTTTDYLLLFHKKIVGCNRSLLFFSNISGFETHKCHVIKTTYVGNTKDRLDPGMVLDGAQCGNEKVRINRKICVDAKCRSISEVTKTVSKCNDKCHDRGNYFSFLYDILILIGIILQCIIYIYIYIYIYSY